MPVVPSLPPAGGGGEAPTQRYDIRRYTPPPEQRASCCGALGSAPDQGEEVCVRHPRKTSR